jgi:hypothetical protein
MPALEDGDLLPKGQILEGELSLATQRRSDGPSHDYQPLEHASEPTTSVRKKAIESTRTNIEEAQLLIQLRNQFSFIPPEEIVVNISTCKARADKPHNAKKATETGQPSPLSTDTSDRVKKQREP